MYTPSKQVLKKYADVLVNFALGKGKGIKPKDIVYIQFDILSTPLALEVSKQILKNGAYPMIHMYNEEFPKIFYKLAREHQLEFFPKKYTKTLIETYDHKIYIDAKKDPLYLKNTPPRKITKVNEKAKIIREWKRAREDAGKLTQTYCIYGTSGKARLAGLTTKEYWKQIEKACFLDKTNPVAEWKKVLSKMERVRSKLTSLSIEKVHLLSKNTDLWINLGKYRKWLKAVGPNVPSFEIYTSPTWRGTEGKIYFDSPFFRHGNTIKNVYFEFKNGKLIKAKSDKNEKFLKELIKQKNVDKIGEFALVDKRFSNIDKFMADTLYDENFGGKWGNSHIALGLSFHEAYSKDPKGLKEKDWQALGFNQAADHCDFILRQNRVVEAILKDGSKKVIYKDGQFTV